MDLLLQELGATGDVVTLEGSAVEAGAYGATNQAILDQVTAMARTFDDEMVAVIVWEGAP
jgi:hypothetical protein